MKIDMRKIYSFQPLAEAVDPNNLPRGGDLYYECQECRGIVCSVSHIKAACDCGNLSAAGGAVQVKEPTRVNVVRGRLK